MDEKSPEELPEPTAAELNGLQGIPLLSQAVFNRWTLAGSTPDLQPIYCPDKLERLLRLGARPELGGRIGRTALHIATDSNRWFDLEVMLPYTQNINVRDNWGQTALHMVAARHGLTEIELRIMRLLLEHGADPDLCDQRGFSPLAYACLDSNFERARSMEKLALLVHHGADLEMQIGGEPLAVLVERNEKNRIHPDVRRFFAEWPRDRAAALALLPPVEPDAFDRDPARARTLLAEGMATNDKMKVRWAVRRGAPINEPVMVHYPSGSIHLMYPLTWACFDYNLLEYLLKRGADPYLDLEEFLSCISGDLDVMRLLFRHGLDANYRFPEGATILHEMVIRNFSRDSSRTRDEAFNRELIRAVITEFLDAGLSINCTDDEGRTPLFWAAEDGCSDAVHVLVELGADHRPNESGETPAQAAWAENQTPIYEYLLSIFPDEKLQRWIQIRKAQFAEELQQQNDPPQP